MQILQTKNEDKELKTKTHYCNIREQQQVQDMKDADIEITNLHRYFDVFLVEGFLHFLDLAIAN